MCFYLLFLCLCYLIMSFIVYLLGIMFILFYFFSYLFVECSLSECFNIRCGLFDPQQGYNKMLVSLYIPFTILFFSHRLFYPFFYFIRTYLLKIFWPLIFLTLLNKWLQKYLEITKIPWSSQKVLKVLKTVLNILETILSQRELYRYITFCSSEKGLFFLDYLFVPLLIFMILTFLKNSL